MVTALYELAIMGSPSDDQIQKVESYLSEGLKAFGLTLGKEYGGPMSQDKKSESLS